METDLVLTHKFNLYFIGLQRMSPTMTWQLIFHSMMIRLHGRNVHFLELAIKHVEMIKESCNKLHKAWKERRCDIKYILFRRQAEQISAHLELFNLAHVTIDMPLWSCSSPCQLQSIILMIPIKKRI